MDDETGYNEEISWLKESSAGSAIDQQVVWLQGREAMRRLAGVVAARVVYQVSLAHVE